MEREEKKKQRMAKMMEEESVRCPLRPATLLCLTDISLCDVCSCYGRLRAQRTRVGGGGEAARQEDGGEEAQGGQEEEAPGGREPEQRAPRPAPLPHQLTGVASRRVGRPN
eukprot:SAG25_NODE_295_length_10249_cov_5.144926_12_plen_111_part_00